MSSSRRWKGRRARKAPTRHPLKLSNNATDLTPSVDRSMGASGRDRWPPAASFGRFRAMKVRSYVLSALLIAFGLVTPLRVYGEAGCLVIEVVMDHLSVPERQPVDQRPSAEREATSSVQPRAKVKALKHTTPAPMSPSLDDQATVRVNAFMLGQNMSNYCGEVKIVEGNETGQYPAA